LFASDDVSVFVVFLVLYIFDQELQQHEGNNYGGVTFLAFGCNLLADFKPHEDEKPKMMCLLPKKKSFKEVLHFWGGSEFNFTRSRWLGKLFKMGLPESCYWPLP